MPQRLGVAAGKRRARLAPGIGEEFQRPACGDCRVELAQGAGGDIARVGEDGFAGGLALGVDRKEPLALHIDFAAHFQHIGPARAGQLFRHVFEGADIGGDVLAGDPVAAGRAQHQPAFFIAQRRRQPVDLGLGHHLDRILGDAGDIRRPAKEIADAGEKIAHVLFVERVFQRQHRDRNG